MVDIHAHIIPYVDDGCSNMEQAIEMIKQEISVGVTDVICTPHHIFNRYETSVEEIKSNFDKLVKEVNAHNLPIKLYLGQEICYSHREDIIEMLKNKQLLTLNNTNKVLLEFSFTREPEEINDIIYRFSIHGYEVIIAHVERYEWITFDKVIALRNEGASIQVNSDAIVSRNDKKEYKFVKKLLKNNLVDYVASDIHIFRPSTMDKAFKIVKRKDLFNNLIY